MDAIERAIQIAGGVTALAEKVGAKSPQVVNNWRARGRIPADMVLKVEQATDGAVNRHELRPDIYPAEATI